MKYYYSKHTGEYCGTVQPCGDMFDYTEIEPPEYDAQACSPIFRDGAWVLSYPEPEREEVPTSVTARQGFIYLHRIGLLETIEAMFDQLPEDERIEAKIEWEKSATIERDNHLLQKVKAMMQWSEEDLDEMFIEANKI